MSQRSEEIWTTLLKARLVEGDEPDQGDIGSPWFVKLLLAFSGWLAAIFLLAFIGFAFEFVFKNSGVAVFVGAAMIGCAFFTLKISTNEFFEHLALAISLAGQVLIVWAIFDLFGEFDTRALLTIALVEAVLILLMSNFIHRVFSSFIAVVCLSFAFASLDLPFVFSGVLLFVVAWLWLHEFNFSSYIEGLRAVGYGSVLALIQIKSMSHFVGWPFWRPAPHDPGFWLQPWMAEILAGAALLYVVVQLLVRYNQAIDGRVGITLILGTLVVCGVSLEAIGVSTGIVIILLGFYGSNRVLMGLGIIFFLFNISAYYYTLDMTLLAKSQTLFIVGAVLIGLRYIGKHLLSQQEEVADGA